VYLLIQIVEVGILLGLMCKHACESSQLMLYGGLQECRSVELDKSGILTNTSRLMKEVSVNRHESADTPLPAQLLREFLLGRRHVTFLLCSPNIQ